MAMRTSIEEASPEATHKASGGESGRAARIGGAVPNSDRGASLDAGKQSGRIGELAAEDRKTLHADAIRALATEDESAWRRYMVELLISSELLVEALCDPSLSRAQAVALARAAMAVDPMTDVTLARFLADKESGEGGKDPKELARLMEVLAEISNGARILPFLKRMARHPNPHVRSKAVLMVGRAAPAPNNPRDRLAEPNPRVRANLVEAVGVTDSEESRALLLAAAQDRNNRVVGNALLALYRLGDASAEPALLKMAEHEAYLFRATCAWVLGEIAEPWSFYIFPAVCFDSIAPSGDPRSPK